MITEKDLYDIVGNKIANEAQKALIRNNFPPQIADRMCAAIDGQEKLEHFIRFLNEYNEWMVQQQMVVQEFLREYYKGWGITAAADEGVAVCGLEPYGRNYGTTELKRRIAQDLRIYGIKDYRTYGIQENIFFEEEGNAEVRI